MMKLSGLSAIFLFTSLIASRSLQVLPRQNSSCENSATNRECWGDYNIGTDYYEQFPDTGVTREYWLVAQNITLAPDGYERQVLCFNGTIPGPTIEADWGDNIVIHVKNEMQTMGTSIHWHGIRQLNSINMDGVPGVTQCPIAPGESMTYSFRATQYGSSWYHSHYSLQLAEGLIGSIVIHGPASANYDVDLGPIMLQDWAHESAFTIWEKFQHKVALYQPVMENGLINGMNPYACQAKDNPAKCVGGGKRFNTTVTQGQKYLLRVIGSQVDGYFKFAIDGHTFQVISSDFVPIVPYSTDSIIVASGQRYDIVVEANNTVGSYWMRAVYQTACNQNNNDNKDNILGIWRYDGADQSDPTTTVSGGATVNACGDEAYASLTPWMALNVTDTLEADPLAVQWYYQLDLVFKWTMHGRTMTVNWSDPITRAIHNNETYPDANNPYILNPVDRYAVFIIQDATLVGAYHPIHLHGHDVYILAQGDGLFDLKVGDWKMTNPPRRDTVSLYGNSWLVIAVKTDNPGAWLMHCHIAWHVSQGLAMNFIERRDEIPSLVAQDLDQYESVCESWDAFKGSDILIAQDDSGV